MNQKPTQNPTQQYPSYNVLKAVLEYEESAAFAERACSSATECRFGSDRASRSVKADINPQIEMPVFNDLMDEKVVPFYERILKRDEDGVLPEAGSISLLNTTVPSSETGSLASNRGRGSPGTFGTHGNKSGGKPAFLTCQLLSILNYYNLISVQCK